MGAEVKKFSGPELIDIKQRANLFLKHFPLADRGDLAESITVPPEEVSRTHDALDILNQAHVIRAQVENISSAAIREQVGESGQTRIVYDIELVKTQTAPMPSSVEKGPKRNHPDIVGGEKAVVEGAAREHGRELAARGEENGLTKANTDTGFVALTPTEERWQERVKARKGEQQGAMYTIEPEGVGKETGLEFRFLLVGEGGAFGLPRGLYAETNVPEELLRDNKRVNAAIRDHILFELAGPSGDSVSPVLDLESTLVMSVSFRTSDGRGVFKIEKPRDEDYNPLLRGIHEGLQHAERIIKEVQAGKQQ